MCGFYRKSCVRLVLGWVSDQNVPDKEIVPNTTQRKMTHVLYIQYIVCLISRF